MFIFISNLLSKFIIAIIKARYAILVTFLFLTIGLMYPASLLPRATTEDLKALARSKLAHAYEINKWLFPTSAATTGYMVYFSTECPKGNTSAHCAIDIDNSIHFANFDYHLEYFCKTGKTLSEKYINDHNSTLWNFPIVQTNMMILSYTSYRSLQTLKFPPVIWRGYLGPNNHSSTAKLLYNRIYSDPNAEQFSKRLNDVIPVLLERHGLDKRGVKGWVVSVPTFINSISESVANSVSRMFVFVFPFSLIIFGVSLSLRLVIIPVVVLIISLITSMAFLMPIAEKVSVDSLSPGICLMMSAAFTFDYSYFWASQYRRLMVEYVESHEEVVKWMLYPRIIIGKGSVSPNTTDVCHNNNMNNEAHGSKNNRNPSASECNMMSIGSNHDEVPFVIRDRSVKEMQVNIMKRLYQTAGRTIFISSQACALCSLGAVYFDSNVIRSIGITAVVTSECVGMTALILPAALISAFPNFFFASLEGWCNAIHPDDCIGSPSAPVFAGRTSGVKEYRKAKVTLAPLGTAPSTQPSTVVTDTNNREDDTDERLLPLVPSDCSGSEKTDPNNPHLGKHCDFTVAVANDVCSYNILRRTITAEEKKLSGRFKRLLRFYSRIITFPINIIVFLIAVGLLAFPMYCAFSFIDYSTNVEQFIPRGSNVLEGWNSYQNNFPAGSLYSYSVLMKFDAKQYMFGVPTSTVFTAQQGLIASLIDRCPETKPKNINSLAYMGALSSIINPNISLQTIFTCNIGLNPHQDLCIYILSSSVIFNTTNRGEGAAGAQIIIETEFDPTKGIGRKWYEGAKKVVSDWDAKVKKEHGDNWGFYLIGEAAKGFDTIDYAEEAFKTVLIVSAIIVFLWLSLTFMSILLAMMILFGVTVSVIAAFGLVSLIYCRNILSWTTWDGVTGNSTLAWQVPFGGILIAAGIAINQELIMLTKIIELRFRGHKTKEAIISGCALTTREGTVSTVIILVIFFGFMLSNVPSINEFSSIFTATAIIEGFIVRIFLTPSLMGLLPFHLCYKYCAPPLTGQ